MCWSYLSGIHTCFVCKSASASVSRCNVPSCGRFFHEQCARSLRLSRVKTGSIRCPMHACATCAADDCNDPLASKGLSKIFYNKELVYLTSGVGLWSIKESVFSGLICFSSNGFFIQLIFRVSKLFINQEPTVEPVYFGVWLFLEKIIEDLIADLIISKFILIILHKRFSSCTGRLLRCLRCPTAYHASEFCLAAGSQIVGGSNIVCSHHSDSTASDKHVNVNWCFLCSAGWCMLFI